MGGVYSRNVIPLLRTLQPGALPPPRAGPGDFDQHIHPPFVMYSTQGIEAVATITELRSDTSGLVEQAKKINSGILIQKNNKPYAVLISYDLYVELLEARDKKKK